MGFFDSMKANQTGTKAYRLHAQAMQLRKTGKYDESEAKLDEALKLYEEAYNMGYRRSNALQGYSLLLMRRGNFERARELMLEVNKDKTLSPDDRFTLRMDFAICQWKMGRLDKAIETVRNAAQNKMNGTVYSSLGMYLVEQAKQTGDFEEALSFNNGAMEYDDEDPAVLDNMGQLYLAMSEHSAKDGDARLAGEQRQKAKEYLEKACELKPEQISSNYYLAKVMHMEGNDARARELIAQAKRIPFSCILQIGKAEVEALEKEIG